MADSPTDPTKILGVDPLAIPAKIGRSVASRLCLTAKFTLASAAQLVALVDDERQLSFYDAEHPQRSDPGLYCYLQRHQGTLYAHGANHGWSYPRLIISADDAARWLWLCTAYNSGDGSYEASTMDLSAAKPLSESDLAPRNPYNEHFEQWLTERLS